MLVSVFIVKIKRYTPVALGTVFFMYFLSMMGGLSSDLDFLKYITPFKMFNTTKMISSLAIEGYAIAITFIIVPVLLTATYILYNKKDFNS